VQDCAQHQRTRALGGRDFHAAHFRGIRRAQRQGHAGDLGQLSTKLAVPSQRTIGTDKRFIELVTTNSNTVLRYYRNPPPHGQRKAYAAEVGRLLANIEDFRQSANGENKWFLTLAKTTGTPERTLLNWWHDVTGVQRKAYAGEIGSISAKLWPERNSASGRVGWLRQIAEESNVPLRTMESWCVGIAIPWCRWRWQVEVFARYVFEESDAAKRRGAGGFLPGGRKPCAGSPRARGGTAYHRVL
jgi:hypothetical protein